MSIVFINAFFHCPAFKVPSEANMNGKDCHHYIVSNVYMGTQARKREFGAEMVYLISKLNFKNRIDGYLIR